MKMGGRREMELTLVKFDPQKHDLSALAALIYAADPEFNQLVYGSSEQGRALIRRLLQLDHNYFAPPYLNLAMHKKRVVGVVVSFPVTMKKQIDMEAGKAFMRVFGFGATLKKMPALIKLDRIVTKKMDPEGCFIHTVSVNTRFRGSGVGRFLLEPLFRDYVTCYLDVNINNPDALAFYQRLGFTIQAKNTMTYHNKEWGLFSMKKVSSLIPVQDEADVKG